VTDEELQASLLQPAPAEAPPDLDPDAALQAELLQPVDAPQGPQPARAADGRVYVVSPLGNLGTVDEAELPALGDGYQLATPEQVAKQIETEEYGDVGSQVAAGLEGAAQGATLGAYGAVAGLVDDGYDRERRLREEYNPVTSTVGQVVGAVAPALLSGGAGAAGTAARLLPAGLEASLGAKMAASLGSKAAAWGAGKAGQLAVRAAATGLESAADVALRTVLDDAANGDVDITAERMLDHAWSGLTTGAALELGMAGLGAAGRAVGRGAKRAAGALMDSLPSVSEAAGEAAYKAAVGRTNRASQRMAERYGGAAAVGQTLLQKELVRAGDTVEEIAERLPAAREAAGQRLSAMLDEVGEGVTSRPAVLQRIEDEVIAPLDMPGTRDVANAVRSKLQASGLAEALSSGDEITLRELHELRRAFDTRPDLKWNSANTADLATDSMRDIRRVLEDTFEQASDGVAKGDFLARLKQAKREYSHLALAAKQAEEGVLTARANNRMGLNDVLAGVGGAAALGDPLGGLATGVVSQVVRPRFESTVAAGLYRLSRKAETTTMLGRLAEGAAEAQQRVVRQADSAVRAVFEPDRRAVARTAVKLASAREIQRATEKAVALQNPDSPESKHLDASVAEIAQQDPQLAAVLRDKVTARAAFIASKVAPPLDASDPLQRTPGRVDAQTARRNGRYVQAAMNPQAALERLSAGVGSVEDIETLRALTPRLYDIFVQRAKLRVDASKRAPTARERMKLAYLLGMPMSSAGEQVAWYQGIQQPASEQQQNPNLAPVTPRAKVNTDMDPRDEVWASRTDEIMAGQ